MNHEYVLHLSALLFAVLNLNLFSLLSSTVCSVKVPKHKCKFRNGLQEKY